MSNKSPSSKRGVAYLKEWWQEMLQEYGEDNQVPFVDVYEDVINYFGAGNEYETL